MGRGECEDLINKRTGGREREQECESGRVCHCVLCVCRGRGGVLSLCVCVREGLLDVRALFRAGGFTHSFWRVIGSQSRKASGDPVTACSASQPAHHTHPLLSALSPSLTLSEMMSCHSWGEHGRSSSPFFYFSFSAPSSHLFSFHPSPSLHPSFLPSFSSLFSPSIASL